MADSRYTASQLFILKLSNTERYYFNNRIMKSKPSKNYIILKGVPIRVVTRNDIDSENQN